jgi:hypothetical protein
LSSIKNKERFFLLSCAFSLSFSLSVFLFTSSSSLLNGGLDSSIQEPHEYTRALLLKRVTTPPLPTKKDTLFFYNDDDDDDDLSERVEEKRLPLLTRKKKKRRRRRRLIFGFGLTRLPPHALFSTCLSVT